MPTREEIIELMEGEEFDQKDEIVGLGTSIVPTLLEIAQKYPDPLMRTRAIILLGEIGNEQARPVLEKVLRDADPVQRLTAARALCRLVGADSISTITELLEDPDIGVSNAAIQCLAEVGDESALAALQRFKTKSTHDFLCSQAEVAIRNIRERIA